MKLAIAVEPVAGNGYRAWGSPPFSLHAEGPTREAAVRNLQELIQQRLDASWEVLAVDVPLHGKIYRRLLACGLGQDVATDRSVRC